MKMFYNELPDTLPDRTDFFKEKTGRFLIENYKICWDDDKVIGNYGAEGRPFTILPFPSTIYITNMGMNISDVDPRKGTGQGLAQRVLGIDFHPIALIRRLNPFNKRLFSPKLKREFAMDKW